MCWSEVDDFLAAPLTRKQAKNCAPARDNWPVLYFMAIFEIRSDTRNRALQQGGRVARRSLGDATGSDEAGPASDEDWITGHLRRVRTEILSEKIPERMSQLLDQLDRLDEPEEENPP